MVIEVDVMKAKPRMLAPSECVRHWFAGLGTVKLQKGSVCFVRWDGGGNGWAYARDCVPVKAINRARDQGLEAQG